MNITPLPNSQECAAAQAADAQSPVMLNMTDLPVLPSASLLRGQKSVVIDHNGSLYRLQTTRQGKLILVK